MLAWREYLWHALYPVSLLGMIITNFFDFLQGSIAGSTVPQDAYDGVAPAAKLAIDDVSGDGVGIGAIPHSLSDGLFPVPYLLSGVRIHR